MSILKTILIAIFVIVILGGAYFLITVRPSLDINEDNLPKIVKADFIDLNRINRISKFRSGEGHDFSSGGEKCRSMKHYFQPGSPSNINPETYVPQEPYINIYSPVDGKIASIQEEGFKVGKQIHVIPDGFPSYRIRLFHVYPKVGLKSGNKVTAGELVGTIGATQGTDIAVEVITLRSVKMVSYFEIMPDEIFAKYQQRGVKSREDLIISKEYRDAHPLSCIGEQFTVKGDNPENRVILKPL